MKPGASLMERFDGWFIKPIEKLKEIPEGDGGFLALSAFRVATSHTFAEVKDVKEKE